MHLYGSVTPTILFAKTTSYWENKCQLKGVVCGVSTGLSSCYLEHI